MAANQNQFNRELGRITTLLNENLTTRVREFGLLLDANLVLATPVDTGHARRNWILDVGNPNFGERPGRRVFIQTVENRTNIEEFELGQTITMHNSIPYLNRLNNGHSRQQIQPGWIERITRRVIRRVFGE